jgi:hypothetical protein
MCVTGTSWCLQIACDGFQLLLMVWCAKDPLAWASPLVLTACHCPALSFFVAKNLKAFCSYPLIAIGFFFYCANSLS